MKFKNSSLLSKVLGSASVQAVGKLISLASGVFFARLLNVSDYGLYGLVISIVSIATLPIIAGLSPLIIRNLAGSNNNTASILDWSFYYTVVLSIVSVATLSLIITFSQINDDLGELLACALLIIPLRALVVRKSAIFNGAGLSVRSQLPIVVILPILTLSAFLTFSFFGNIASPKLLIFFTIASYSIVIILYSSMQSGLVRDRPVFYDLMRKNIFRSSYFKEILPLSALVILATMINDLAVIILGLYSITDEVAYFKIAIQALSIVQLCLYSVNVVIAPKVAQMYKSDKLDSIKELLRKSVRISTLLSAPVIIIFCIIPEQLVTFLFGAEYAPAGRLILVLCLAQVVNILSGSVGLVLNMTNNEYLAIKIQAVSLVTLILISWLLVPTYGALGAAYALAFNIVFSNVAMAYATFRKTGLKTWLT